MISILSVLVLMLKTRLCIGGIDTLGIQSISVLQSLHTSDLTFYFPLQNLFENRVI